MAALGLKPNGLNKLTRLPAFRREESILNTQKTKMCTAWSQMNSAPYDFTIFCVDGYIYVHKQLLADSCYCLRQFLNSDEMKQRTGMLFRASSNVALTILYYLYGVNGLSNLLISFTDLVEVISISHEMQLSKTWINHCYRALTSRFLSISNFHTIWRLTQRLGNTVNKETTEKFFKNNLIKITKKRYIEKFDKNEMKSLLELFDKEEDRELMVEMINVWRLRDLNRKDELLKVVKNMDLKSAEFLPERENC